MKLLSIFYQFLLLGCTSFGGPAAHLGYFQRHFVENKKWLSQQQYGHFISLSQLLPGPGSSQVGFAIGVERAGLAGGIAAFIGFTLPSMLIMVLLALGAQQLPWATGGLITGLKLFAVVIVADAVFSMSKSFCRTWQTRALALLSAGTLILMPSLYTQLLILVLAAVWGAWRLQPFSDEDANPAAQDKAGGLSKLPLLLFALLFILSFAASGELWQLGAQFYQAGSLVFGGGHVVLPLLDTILTDVDADSFLTGYAAAQAIPGPMFTFATYLGAVLAPSTPLLGALIATLAIFIPGFLLVLGCARHWQALMSNPVLAGVSTAINATVVGFILAALYSPIIPAGLTHWWYVVFVALGWWLLQRYKPPVLMLIATFAALGLLLEQLPR
ncbi:chromate efflux transporter [Pseudoalteromonas sp. T1lg48]|uniref:chromate efflux transporter n=1 Tax=Pseudoalteromonas sp. T1lg48 TaxID=2077100 RepID=UPI000CF65205|nr:chromate efflux transporter [Pseudoalteromonas sp. T1lg48]